MSGVPILALPLPKALILTLTLTPTLTSTLTMQRFALGDASPGSPGGPRRPNSAPLHQRINALADGNQLQPASGVSTGCTRSGGAVGGGSLGAAPPHEGCEWSSPCYCCLHFDGTSQGAGPGGGAGAAVACAPDGAAGAGSAGHSPNMRQEWIQSPRSEVHLRREQSPLSESRCDGAHFARLVRRTLPAAHRSARSAQAAGTLSGLLLGHARDPSTRAPG